MRGLSHGMAHKNVNIYTLDPLITQCHALLKQIDSDLERYDRRATEIYSNYLPELRIKKKKEETDDEKIEHKVMYDIEVIKKLWKIKDNKKMGDKYRWTKNSVGIDLSDSDWQNLQRIVDLFEMKRENRNDMEIYLKEKVQEHAPDLNALLGHMLAAELIALTGSLINLAKCSSSTVQVLGTEKALFRSLKKKTATPKYGILKNNGMTSSARIIRSLASKIVICARIDAFRKEKTTKFGKALRDAINAKIISGKKIDTSDVLVRVCDKMMGKKSKNEENMCTDKKSEENIENKKNENSLEEDVIVSKNASDGKNYGKKINGKVHARKKGNHKKDKRIKTKKINNSNEKIKK